MMRKFLAMGAALLALAAPPAALAQDRVTLGWGQMMTNDSIGDAHDRWRTGSHVVSLVRGPHWSGALPSRPGEILEFRFRAEAVAPESLSFVPPGDRRYAGVLSLGLHSHFETAGWETSLGADLVLIGPQTHVSEVQKAIHDLLGFADPVVAASQIGNAAYPTLVFETGRSLAFAGGRIRPFVEAQAGLETLVRAGFDLSFGRYGEGALMLRDQTSGQRYRAVAGALRPGFSLSLGGDIARVFDSALLPEGEQAVLSDTRSRLRAGIAWQGERASVFYGLTWLGKEFDSQRDGQLVGSLSLRLAF
ncbi:MAG: DUF2219 family protein [Paracoccaceae bacterium]